MRVLLKSWVFFQGLNLEEKYLKFHKSELSDFDGVPLEE